MDSISKFGFYVLIFSGIASLSQGCVSEYKSALKECMDPLKSAISGQNVDVNDVFCRPNHRAGLNCVIKYLRNCTELLEDPYVSSFQKGDFAAEDLTKVTSAEVFCKCAPTLQCLEQLVFKNGFMASQGTSPWKQIHAPYVCGSKKPSIECVSSSLPACTMYLQHKHPAFTADDAIAVEKAPEFAGKYCSKVDKDYAKNMNCTRERSQVHTLPFCVREVKLREDLRQRVCGQFNCIIREMEPCKYEWVEFFIETINVYTNEPIPLTGCPVSGAVSSVFSLVAIILSLLVSLYF